MNNLPVTKKRATEKKDQQFLTSALISWCSAIIIILTLMTGCAPKVPVNDNKHIKLTLGAYTTPREVYGKAIIPAFKKYWLEKTGQEVEILESYQGSGAQARAIVSGFEADIAALSLEADIDKLTSAGLISHNWKDGKHKGMISNSIVVLAVRNGNPKEIKDWVDLTKPGLNILTPDPKTSGGAQWNINAIYGAALRSSQGLIKEESAKTTAVAPETLLKQVFQNVTIMDKGARESITNFEKGVGDVAITYENEVLTGQQAGQDYQYIIPRSTILIENPIALIDKYVDKHGTRKVAEGFIEFLHSKEAQLAFAKYGFRSVDDEVAQQTGRQFPPVLDLWTIDYLGGWPKVAQDIYGPQGVYTKVIEELHLAK